MNSPSDVQAQREDLGVLLFAFDNEQINYLDLARECARRIHKHWGAHIPVSVVMSNTNDFVDYHSELDILIKVDPNELKANHKIYHEYGQNLSFWNSNRHRAIDYTPYRYTILMDVDLLVQTDDIIRLYDRSGLKLAREAYSVFDYHPLSTDMRVLGTKSSIPMYWATVVCFDKENDDAKAFFKEWARALSTYSAQGHIHGFAPKPVRNDFAVSLALYRLLDQNYQDQRFLLPYELASLMPQSEVTRMHDDCMLVRNHEGGTTAVYSDLHVMNKKSILTCLTQLIKES